MGLYSFFLAGSNYFAPVICGFIAEYQGWQWVFYWPSIFIAFALVFLFFFMEETNYMRETGEATTPAGPPEHEEPDQEKADISGSSEVAEPAPAYKKKSYIQKLSLLGPRQPNNMFRRFYQILYYLTWPLIFYAGYIVYAMDSILADGIIQILLRLVSHLVQRAERDGVYHLRLTSIQLQVHLAYPPTYS